MHELLGIASHSHCKIVELTWRIQGMELMLRIGKSSDSPHGWDPRKVAEIWFELICYLWDIICRPINSVQDFDWVGSIWCFFWVCVCVLHHGTVELTHTNCWDSSDPSHSKQCTLKTSKWTVCGYNDNNQLELGADRPTLWIGWFIFVPWLAWLARRWREGERERLKLRAERPCGFGKRLTV